MSWIFDHLGLIVFAAIAFSVVRKVKGFLKRVETETARRGQSSRSANHDPEEARRVQQIQEEIRRKIAERRGGARPPQAETALPPPPLLQPRQAPPVRPLDPFGGPLTRTLMELERRVQPQAPAPVVTPERSQRAAAAEMARQEQLAEQLRELQESRMLAERRATQVRAAEKQESESEAGMLATTRGTLLTELRDPQSLRRAFVLREVLGAPVGLR